jgi:hypothetical protein
MWTAVITSWDSEDASPQRQKPSVLSAQIAAVNRCATQKQTANAAALPFC